MILADMEGASCIFSEKQCSTGSSEWKRSRYFLTSNVNAVVKGIFSEDKEAKIVVRDVHNQCYNILTKSLDPRVEYIGGPYHKPIIWFGDLSGFDLAFMVGIHARSGSAGFQPHTQCLEFADVRINDKSISETEFTASLISENITPPYPVGFVSGEAIAIKQARESLPWLIGCSIAKTLCTESLSEQLHKENSILESQAAKTIRKMSEFKLFNFSRPFKVEIRYYEKTLASKVSERWKLPLQSDERTFFFYAKNTEEFLLQTIKMMYLTPWMAKLIPFTPLLRPLYRLMAL
ncbi:MAG: M55 family metallopeptidase [Candidatus Hodarchaeales archaeon]